MDRGVDVAGAARPVVRLKKGKSRFVAAGHPWIFSGAIAATQGTPAPGDVVAVQDHAGAALGLGLYSPESQIRVRMLAPEAGALEHGALVGCLERARRRRRALGFPGAETTGYRLVNSEGDGLPGLVVDVLGSLVVMQLTTLPMVMRRAQLVAALQEVFAGEEIALRETAPAQAIASAEGFARFEGWHTDWQPERVTFTECGVRFGVDTAQFQKTGHFADMRPHRAWVAARSEGLRVLDAFCYTGAFGLMAARAGAARVVCVDSSAAAIARVEENVVLNGWADRVEAVTQRADAYLREAAARGERFDIVVLDPPKYAPNRSALNKALRRYTALINEGVGVLAEGGMFCITSCSGLIGLSELERALAEATVRGAPRFQVVYSGHQGPDHPYPAPMPEGRYATFVATLT